MTQNEYNRFRTIAFRVCKGDERAEDLMHDVLLQLSTNVVYTGLNIEQKFYFFSRSMSNQFNSTNSQFYRTYRRRPEPIEPEEIEEEYVDTPSIEWVNEILDQEQKENPAFWYDAGIFRLYIKHKKLEELHRRTMIPKYSLRDTIKKVKELLREKWDKLN